MYYKTNDPAVLAAWEADRQARVDFKKKVDSFAAYFGGEGMIYSNPVRFAGIKFKGDLPKELWCARDSNGLQRPRMTAPKGASMEQKKAIKHMRDHWMKHVPKDVLRDDDLYKALGHSNSLDFLFGGLTMFLHDGWVYAKTGSVAMPALTEIMGSEYEEAERAHRA